MSNTLGRGQLFPLENYKVVSVLGSNAFFPLVILGFRIYFHNIFLCLIFSLSKCYV